MNLINVTRVIVREVDLNEYEISLPSGVVLASGMAAPEGAACAALHSRGVTGIMATYWAGDAYPSAMCDIAKKAASYQRESESRGRLAATVESLPGEC